MYRVFVDPDVWTSERMALPAEAAHHLLHVRRAQPGDTIAVSDGAGREALCELQAGAGCSVRVLSRREQPRRVPEVTLLQCLPKGRHMDVIVEKAVELGVAAVVPVISEHVVKRPQGARGAQQADRWRRVARAAAQQCQTLWVPAVSDPVGIEEACAVGECQARFYCGSLAADARPWREVLREEKRPPPTVAVLIGPEGDLSPRERERAARSGAVGVSFGSLVLRVETAALYALSALTYEFASC